MVEGTARQVGDHVMLDTERGYHLNLEPGEAGELRRPVVFADRGFVLAPMLDGIRLTSGVELASVNAPPDFSRIRRLLPAAREALPGLSGSRHPPMDGLSAIHAGFTAGDRPIAAQPRRCIYAFGHQHLGLTLGPITGRLIAAAVAGGSRNSI